MEVFGAGIREDIWLLSEFQTVAELAESAAAHAQPPAGRTSRLLTQRRSALCSGGPWTQKGLPSTSLPSITRAAHLGRGADPLVLEQRKRPSQPISPAEVPSPLGSEAWLQCSLVDHLVQRASPRPGSAPVFPGFITFTTLVTVKWPCPLVAFLQHATFPPLDRAWQACPWPALGPTP